ncbi:MAG: hypothetical protein K0B07_03150 [DPANN group archaeon]|nr:hypothetical protein [DPANN group archaeon]
MFVSFLMLIFAPISASSGAYVDYNSLAFDVVALWFIGGIAYFVNRKW